MGIARRLFHAGDLLLLSLPSCIHGMLGLGHFADKVAPRAIPDGPSVVK